MELTRRVFAALAKGDSAPAVESLGADVRWSAVASREPTGATTLDRRGAEAYLKRMARSISSGERGLEVTSVAADGDTVRMVSSWTERGRASERCGTIVTFADGKVISVVKAAGDRAMLGVRGPPEAPHTALERSIARLDLPAPVVNEALGALLACWLDLLPSLATCREHILAPAFDDMPVAPSAISAGAGCRARSSRRDDGMGQATAGQPQAGGDVLELEVGQLLDDLGGAQAGGQQIEHVGDPNTQASHAGASAALRRVDGDAISQRGHRCVLRLPPASLWLGGQRSWMSVSARDSDCCRLERPGPSMILDMATTVNGLMPFDDAVASARHATTV